MSERRFDAVQSFPCTFSHVDMSDRFLHIRLIRLVELVMCSHLARRLFTVRIRAEDDEEVAATDRFHDVLRILDIFVLQTKCFRTYST